MTNTNNHPTHALYAEIHGAVLKAMRCGVEAPIVQVVLANIQREFASAIPYLDAATDAKKAP